MYRHWRGSLKGTRCDCVSKRGECLEDKKYSTLSETRLKKVCTLFQDNTKLFMSFKNRVKDHSGVNIYGEGKH